MPEKRICSGCAKEFWWPGAQWQHDGCVVAVHSSVLGVASNGVANAKKDMANSMANKIEHAGATYRYRDAEARRVYQRELMRRHRAEKKARVSP